MVAGTQESTGDHGMAPLTSTPTTLGLIEIGIPRDQAAAVPSGPGEGVLGGHAGQPWEPRVGTGVTDVDHQM